MLLVVHLNLVLVVVVEALSSEICAVAPVLKFYAFQVAYFPPQTGYRHWHRDFQP